MVEKPCSWVLSFQIDSFNETYMYYLKLLLSEIPTDICQVKLICQVQSWLTFIQPTALEFVCSQSLNYCTITLFYRAGFTTLQFHPGAQLLWSWESSIH